MISRDLQIFLLSMRHFVETRESGFRQLRNKYPQPHLLRNTIRHLFNKESNTPGSLEKNAASPQIAIAKFSLMSYN